MTGWPAAWPDRAGRIRPVGACALAVCAAGLPRAPQVRVRVWGADGAAFGMERACAGRGGLLNARRLDRAVHHARLGRRYHPPAALPAAAPRVRRPRRRDHGARLYVTALGVYEAQLNGAAVGDHVLAPGWTSYNHRLRYQTFDVTDLLHEGRNALGAMLGDGWYRGRLGFGGGRRNIYGDRLALLAQLEITYADGTTERIVTDESWRAATGPILASDIYDGETYDARLERPGWSTPGYDDRDWAGVRPLERDLATLVAPIGPAGAPHRSSSRRSRSSTSPSGPHDRRLRPEPGRPAAPDACRGRPGRRSRCATPRCWRTASCAPARCASRRPPTATRCGAAAWRPGSRASPSTASATPRSRAGPASCKPDDIRAVVCHSDMERTGWFECSDPLINRLHENVVWSMRGNFLDVPTDCPQRDERLGWTGDIQVFSPTACFLYDMRRLPALVAGRPGRRAGSCRRHRPLRRPECDRPTPLSPAAAWGDAAVIVRGCCTSATAIRHPGRAVRQHARLGRSDRRDRRREHGCGNRASSSATGSTRARRRINPADARTDPYRGRHRLLRPLGRAGGAGSRRARPGRGRGALPRPGRRGARGLRRRVRHACRTGDQRRRDRLRAGAAVRAAAQTPSSASMPASGWPRWCAAAATTSAPASSARR